MTLGLAKMLVYFSDMFATLIDLNMDLCDRDSNIATHCDVIKHALC